MTTSIYNRDNGPCYQYSAAQIAAINAVIEAENATVNEAIDRLKLQPVITLKETRDKVTIIYPNTDDYEDDEDGWDTLTQLIIS